MFLLYRPSTVRKSIPMTVQIEVFTTVIQKQCLYAVLWLRPYMLKRTNIAPQ